MIPTPEVLELRVEGDIVACRRAVRRLTQSLHFSLVDQTRMITAASELARNALEHGGGGKATLEELDDGARRGLRIAFEDQGKGIADIALALKDGYTSGGGMGHGLGGSKRLVDDFDIVSAPGKGTRVTIGRWR